MALVKSEATARARVGNGSESVYSPGKVTRLFEWSPVDGYDRNGRRVDGLLAFIEVDRGYRQIIGKDSEGKTDESRSNLLYWSSLHKDVTDEAGKTLHQSPFGEKLHELFVGQMTVVDAQSAMLQALQAVFEVGEPTPYIELKLNVEEYITKNLKGERTPKRFVKVTGAKFVPAPTALAK